MNNEKTGGGGRVIAFFIIAAGLALLLGAASGRGAGATTDADDPPLGNTNNPSVNDGTAEDDTPEEPEPSYRYNYLTGMKEGVNTPVFKPTAYVMSTDAALYGVSQADVLVEIPIEDGNTRLMAIFPYGTRMGKIGAIAPTRGYISTLAESFGATLISYGSDDTRVYPGVTPSEHLDLALQSGYHYTEYTKYAYSNADLIHRALANSAMAMTPPTASLPYNFLPEGESLQLSLASARKLIIPYSASDKTELFYSESDGSYTIAKAGSALYDMLDGGTPSFRNVFILYADSVTYETSSNVSFIMDTFTSGSGIYATDGSAKNIHWTCSETGEMSFFAEDGSPLNVNRGKTYVSFFKSSVSTEIQIN